MMSEATMIQRPEMAGLSPIPVQVVNEEKARNERPEHAALFTVTVNNGDQPQQLIPQDRNRAVCVINVRGAVNQSIVIARQKGVSNNRGFLMVVGDTLNYAATSELWYVPQAANGAVTISVCDQRYDAEVG